MASGSINQMNPSSSLEYKFHEASLSTPKEKGETYHLIAEALKFGNMLKPEMKDPAFSEAKVSYCSAWEYWQTPATLAASSVLLERGETKESICFPFPFFSLSLPAFSRTYSSLCAKPSWRLPIVQATLPASTVLQHQVMHWTLLPCSHRRKETIWNCYSIATSISWPSVVL